MRFVPTNCLTPKMALANSIYDAHGELLIPKGATLNRSMIEALRRLDFNGVYIESLFGEEEPVSIVSTLTRKKAISAIKRMTALITIDDVSNEERELAFKAVSNVIYELVDEITENSNLMINMVDMKNFDEYTYNHSVNVTILSIALGAAFELNKQELYNLGVGALLHDMGKAFIPLEIINKPDTLTESEFSVVMKHPRAGLEYIEQHLQVPYESLAAVIDHHERFDGTGYPMHKRGDNISLYGSIVGVADVFDAITTDRPYKKSISTKEAVEYVMGGSGIQFNPKVVELFIKKISPYPVGSIVKLSNGDVAKVILCENRSLRPVVSVYIKDGMNIETPEVVDLQEPENFSITIVEEIRPQELSFVREEYASEHTNLKYVRRR